MFHLKVPFFLMASPLGGLGAVDKDGWSGRAAWGVGDAQAESRFYVKEFSILSPRPLLVPVGAIAQAYGHHRISEKALLFPDMDNLKPLWRMKSSSSTMYNNKYKAHLKMKQPTHESAN